MRSINKIITVLSALFAVNCAAAATGAEHSSTVYTEDKPAIMVTAAHPEFTIKLQSNPTTGYSWFVRSYDVNFVQPVKHAYEASTNKKLMGAPGYETWTFRIKPSGFTVPVQTAVRFVYARPWETSDQSRQVVFLVTTQGK